MSPHASHWTGSHDHALVALSVVIAILAAYVALDLAGRVKVAAGRPRTAWLTGGAIAMGTGIWSMHYLGMLAFKLPVPVQYHWPTVAASLVAAIAASAIALFVTSLPTMGLFRAVVGSVFMGTGIAGMHYIGMAAMRLAATTHYSAGLVALSIALAIVISFVALWLTFHLRDVSQFTWRRANSAIFMGLAIPVMHYTGMAAASFSPAPGAAVDLSRAVSISALGTLGIIGVTFMVLGLALVTSVVDRRFSARMQREDSLLRESAAKLREDAERREFILRAAGIGMWEQNLAAGTSEWSNTMEVIHGLPRARFPKTLDAFLANVHPDDRAMVVDEFQRLIEGGVERTKEYRVVWPDGSEHWIESTARVRRDDAGRAVFVSGLDRDVTRRRLLEDHLRQSQKMDAIGQLAGGVAHDFNNLLTAIVGFSELILESDEGSEAVRHDVGEILKAAQSAGSLTRQLLAFSRRQMLDPQVLDLSQIVADMESMMRRLLGEHIELVTVLPPSIWHVFADKGQIEQVVMNLSVNARDAMPSGGTLWVETANVDVDQMFVMENPGSTAGRYVCITVRDTGTGMDESVRSHLFEPFFTTKTFGKGTGLGLATVYGIVTQSHGFITVESEPGRGTEFRVFLPETAEEPADGEAAPAPPPELLGTETILLVEDQPEVRAVTRAVLARHGYTVLIAEDADDALSVLARTPGIDLVLTDVVMPGMDGRELGRRVSILYPRTSVLYMSGYAHVIADADGILERGLTFLQKPFTTKDLTEKVRLVLLSRALQTE